jgi:hypothetical protein
MGVIEETRQLIQDFLAPELRSIAARLDSIEAKMDERFKGVDERLKGIEERFKLQDWRMNSAEQLASDRHAQILQAVARLADVYELKERVARIEAREKAS